MKSQMTTLLFSHPSSLEHDTGPGHPERAERAEAVNRALAAAEFEALVRRRAPRADNRQIARIHDPA